ncbi:MAG TPA: hypothetical protein VEI94_08755 [Candidatus Bathyarchaeia archaeon]|nr:hypothetical protein [Candidatus Bathyarchaeia archaeon]
MHQRSTNPGDIVLIHVQGRAASFARVEAVRPHDRRGWYYCDLLVLAVPPQAVSWILERAQIDGADFTMGGRPVRIERMPDIGALHSGPHADTPLDGAGPLVARTAATSIPVRTNGAAVAGAKAAPRRERTRPVRATDGNVVRLFPRKSPA